jgi:hypothetical protein
LQKPNQFDETEQHYRPLSNSSRRPQSASAASTPKKPSKYFNTSMGISLDDWNGLVSQCLNEELRFSYLKKGSRTGQQYETTEVPNLSTRYLKEQRSKRNEEQKSLKQELKKDNFSKIHYIHQCIEEVNELCRELSIFSIYEFHNEKVVKKTIYSNSFPPPAVLSLPSATTPKTPAGPPLLTSAKSMRDFPIDDSGTKEVKLLSLAKFNREHEDILQRYKIFRKNNPLTMATTSTGEGDLNDYQDEKPSPLLMKPPMIPRKHPIKQSINASIDPDNDYDNFDDEEMNQQTQRSLNEMEKRKLIQNIQEQILIDLYSKDKQLSQQIDEIKHRGWNKTLY